MWKLLTVTLTLSCSMALAQVPQGLDELRSRRDRQEFNTFYSGENPAQDHLWQPMTMSYRDSGTGREVWRLTSTPNVSSWAIEEYAYPTIWSADGKRLSLSMRLSTGTYSRTRGNAWFFLRSDGSRLRPGHDAPARTTTHRDAINWSPVEPDVFYQVGGVWNDEPYDDRYLYRATVGDRAISVRTWIDFGQGASVDQINKTMAPDGRRAVVYNGFRREGPVHAVTLLPEDSRGINATWAFDSPARDWDTYWGDANDPWDSDIHNGHLAGNAAEGYWFYILVGSRSWVRTTMTGSASDGGPDHDSDRSTPFQWGGEIEPVGTRTSDSSVGEGHCVAGSRSPWCCDNELATECVTYWSHPSFDRWGRYVFFSNTTWDEVSRSSPSTYDLQNEDWVVRYYTPSIASTQHNSWQAFSDWATFYTAQHVGYAKYDDPDAAYVVCDPEESSGFGDDDGANQSPDGTKVSYISAFLNATDDASHADVYYAVAYYPYPPEIVSTSASAGTVNVRVNWRLDTASPRGYTKRGWPDESEDDPPPPREIERFRLWRCGDNAGAPDGNWVPVGATEPYDIFSRYDFSTGNWSGSSNWTLTDTPPADGRYHYAVTSIEHSGLESQTLSNSFGITLSEGQGNGTQSGSYPAEPGADSGFYDTIPARPRAVRFAHCSAADCSAMQPEPNTSGQYLIEWQKPADASLVRYYNVYARDGSSPATTQSRRIASFPGTACTGNDCRYVDWLGSRNGSTRYAVTSVDMFGNESAAGEGGDPDPPEPPPDVEGARRTDVK